MATIVFIDCSRTAASELREAALLAAPDAETCTLQRRGTR